MGKSKKAASNGSAAASGKKDATTTGRSNQANNANSNVSLEEQLDRALTAVTTNYEQTMTLHEAWRAQLSRISFLVLCVIMTQVKEPGAQCFAAVKAWNAKMESYHNSEDVVSKMQAVVLMTKDSLMEGMSFFCALCLVWWIATMPVETIRHNREFAALPFRVASSLLPLIVFTWTQQRTMGCMRQLEDPYPEETPTESDEAKRSFPVVLIFYVVTALSMFAMKKQRNSGEDQIHKIQKLKKDLMEPKKKK